MILKLALQNFRAEEEKHTEMFWRVLEKTGPDYRQRKFRFFNISYIQNVLVFMF